MLVEVINIPKFCPAQRGIVNIINGVGFFLFCVLQLSSGNTDNSIFFVRKNCGTSPMTSHEMTFICRHSSCYVLVLVACSNWSSNSVKYRLVQNARTLNVVEAKPNSLWLSIGSNVKGGGSASILLSTMMVYQWNSFKNTSQHNAAMY